MRTNEERITALHMRVREMKTEKLNRRVKAAWFAGSVLGFVAIFICSFMTERMTMRMLPISTAGSFGASIFSDSSILGFLVIGIVAFLLGITVTIFCFYLKKWGEEHDGEDLP